MSEQQEKDLRLHLKESLPNTIFQLSPISWVGRSGYIEHIVNKIKMINVFEILEKIKKEQQEHDAHSI